jgi:predicted PurR-regulated permease PerM
MSSFSIGKTGSYILSTFFLLVILYFGKALFIPLAYGLFIAIVLYPFCKWLEQHRFSRTVAVTISVLLVIVLFSILIAILALQVKAFNNDLPELQAKAKPFIEEFKNRLASIPGIPFNEKTSIQEDFTSGIVNNIGGLLSASISKIGSGLFTLFIIPVFAALFLYNRESFVLFLNKLAGEKYNTRLYSVLHHTVTTYFHFIKGMIFVYIIVGILNSAGLLALGIRHAVLFGFLTAIMTIIPYLGIFISALLPVTVAWITKDSIWYPIGVIVVFIFVQYLEANVIFPKVVATQLNLSTWATLVAIIAGGIVWGVSGMILFIPAAGILKLISSHIPEWEPLNILLSRDKT